MKKINKLISTCSIQLGFVTKKKKNQLGTTI